MDEYHERLVIGRKIREFLPGAENASVELLAAELASRNLELIDERANAELDDLISDETSEQMEREGRLENELATAALECEELIEEIDALRAENLELKRQLTAARLGASTPARVG